MGADGEVIPNVFCIECPEEDPSGFRTGLFMVLVLFFLVTTLRSMASAGANNAFAR